VYFQAYLGYKSWGLLPELAVESVEVKTPDGETKSKPKLTFSQPIEPQHWELAGRTIFTRIQEEFQQATKLQESELARQARHQKRNFNAQVIQEQKVSE
jgi:hypothetical protein